MENIINRFNKALFCLILIMSSCAEKDNSRTKDAGDTLSGSVNYNDPAQRDSAHIDSSFRNGLGY